METSPFTEQSLWAQLRETFADQIKSFVAIWDEQDYAHDLGRVLGIGTISNKWAMSEIMNSPAPKTPEEFRKHIGLIHSIRANNDPEIVQLFRKFRGDYSIRARALGLQIVDAALIYLGQVQTEAIEAEKKFFTNHALKHQKTEMTSAPERVVSKLQAARTHLATVTSGHYIGDISEGWLGADLLQGFKTQIPKVPRVPGQDASLVDDLTSVVDGTMETELAKSIQEFESAMKNARAETDTAIIGADVNRTE